MRVAVKRTDLECVQITLEELAEWLQIRAAAGESIPPHLIADTAYFAAHLAGVINHAPRVRRDT